MDSSFAFPATRDRQLIVADCIALFQESMWDPNQPPTETIKARFCVLLSCRTRSLPIRTEDQIEVTVKISLNKTVPMYRMLAPKIKELKALVMSYREIGGALGVDKGVVVRGSRLN